ncbi:hypothetical protein BaRGS_00006029 [Batillaria attramentaria]|uniref:Ribosomal protein L20 n=1 Tax=Batillaria attramentaria TaxID=370345 RepID=A0ABD0LUT5_9CAEN
MDKYKQKKLNLTRRALSSVFTKKVFLLRLHQCHLQRSSSNGYAPGRGRRAYNGNAGILRSEAEHCVLRATPASCEQTLVNP